jgi:hypothetical protein
VSKLLLISVIAGLVAIPAIAAREPNAKRGLKKALFYTLAFNVWYYLALRFIWPRL